MSASTAASPNPLAVGSTPDVLPWIVANRAANAPWRSRGRDPAAPGGSGGESARQHAVAADARRTEPPQPPATRVADPAGSHVYRCARAGRAGGVGVRWRHPAGRWSGSWARRGPLGEAHLRLAQRFGTTTPMSRAEYGSRRPVSVPGRLHRGHPAPVAGCRPDLPLAHSLHDSPITMTLLPVALRIA